MKKATKRKPKPRVVWLQESLKATDSFLADLQSDSEATSLVATLMSPNKFNQLLAELRRFRARLVEELKPHEVGK